MACSIGNGVGSCTSPQIYIIPSMHAVWAEDTGGIQLNSPQRLCKPAKGGGSYVEPSLNREIRPSSALYHQVTLLQAREYDLVVKSKQWEKQKKLKHAVSKHSVSRWASRGSQLHA